MLVPGKQEMLMPVFRSDTSTALLVVGAALWAQSAVGSDLIVSANDGKYVRDEGVSTYPQPAPSDSLAVNNAAPFVLFAIKDGTATRVKGLPSGEAAQGTVFARTASRFSLSSMSRRRLLFIRSATAG
jgi:hypothetical protein